MSVVKASELLGLLTGRRNMPTAVLIHGADRSAVHELCQRVVAKVTGGNDDALNVSRLTDAQLAGSKDRLYEEFASISMFGGSHVVWVSGAGDVFTKLLEPILAGEQAGNLILADAESLPKTSRLRKLFEANANCASVALYEESAHELRGRLERQILAAGLTITEEALARLMEFISFERAVADSETQKLITYCLGQREIDIEDVLAICGDTSDISFDDLVDAVFEGNLEDADRFVMTLSASPAAGRGSLSVVLQHIVRMQAMAGQVNLGSSIDSVVSAPRFGIFFKRRASISHQLRNWDLTALLNAEEKICAAVLQTRQYPDLDDAITSRTLLALSRAARSRTASRN